MALVEPREGEAGGGRREGEGREGGRARRGGAGTQRGEAGDSERGWRVSVALPRQAREAPRTHRPTARARRETRAALSAPRETCCAQRAERFQLAPIRGDHPHRPREMAAVRPRTAPQNRNVIVRMTWSNVGPFHKN